MKEEFIDEIEMEISRSRLWHKTYVIVHLLLTVSIAAFGFLTAAGANSGVDENSLLFSSSSMMIYGLLSASCAVILQAVNPQRKAEYHRGNKHSLWAIRDEVKFDLISVQEGQTKRSKLREQAVTAKPEYALANRDA